MTPWRCAEKGILKVLHEGPTTDWTTVILDVSEEPRV